MASSSAPSAVPGAPPRQSFSLLNDEPLADRTQDLLSSYQAAGALTQLLTDSRTATPFTLAVDAGWGMGKSSLMRLVDARLRDFPEISTVWYNAWSSTGPDALEGLIKSVLYQVDRNVLRRWVRRLRDGGRLTAFLRALTVLAAGPLGVSAMVDELWRRLSADPGARNGMRDALRGLVGEWTASVSGDRGRLLVVFIDDLDRCGEDTFLAVCEAVKVYLDVPGLAFVIGCDRSAIGPTGLLRDLSPAGTAFAEKIFQTSYRIPAPSGPDIRAYVRSCARQAGIDGMLDEHLVELLAYRAARNPRRVKRLVNGLLLEASLNPIWAGVRSEAVIRTLLLQYLYPDFYRMMTTPAGPGDGDVVREFRTYRSVRGHLWKGEPWTEEVTREVGGFLRAYSLPPLSPHPLEPGLRPSTLARLEQLLPTDFPALAGDPAFVSLVDELVGLPESRLVLRRLREGVDQPLERAMPVTPAGDPTTPPYAYPDPYRAGGRPPEEWGQPLPAPSGGRPPAWYPAAPADRDAPEFVSDAGDAAPAGAPAGDPAEAGAGSPGPAGPRGADPARDEPREEDREDRDGEGDDDGEGGDRTPPAWYTQGPGRPGPLPGSGGAYGYPQPGPYLPPQGTFRTTGDRPWQQPQGAQGAEPPPYGGSVPPAYGAPVSPALEDEERQAVQPGSSPGWYGQRPRSQPPQAAPVPVAPTSALPVRLAGFEPATASRLAEDLSRLGLTVRLDDPQSGRWVSPVEGVVTVCHFDALAPALGGFYQDLDLRPPRGRELRGPLVLFSPRLTPFVEIRAARLDVLVTDDLGRLAAEAYDLAVRGARSPTPLSSPYGPGSGGPSDPAAPPSGGPRP